MNIGIGIIYLVSKLHDVWWKLSWPDFLKFQPTPCLCLPTVHCWKLVCCLLWTSDWTFQYWLSAQRVFYGNTRGSQTKQIRANTHLGVGASCSSKERQGEKPLHLTTCIDPLAPNSGPATLPPVPIPWPLLLLLHLHPLRKSAPASYLPTLRSALGPDTLFTPAK